MLLPLLAGCVTKGAPLSATAAEIAAAEPASGLGRIYFYRERDAFLGAIEPGIVVNGKRVGTARYGEIFFRDALPGRYEVFSTHNDDTTAAFALAEGESVYIKTAPRLDGLCTELTAVLVDPETGAAEAGGLDLVQGDEPGDH
ncbi:MAG: hypothetical protein WD489_10620 [Rhodovibrionaceae bacterium]